MPDEHGRLINLYDNLRYLKEQWRKTEAEPYPEGVVDRINRNKYQTWLLRQIQLVNEAIKRDGK